MDRLRIYDTTIPRENILRERAAEYQSLSPQKKWNKMIKLIQLALHLKGETPLKRPQAKGIILKREYMKRDALSDEMFLLLQTFYECKVKYLLVGGFAVNRYGYSRTTGDIDIFLKDSKKNRQNLIEALEKMEYGRFDMLLNAPIVAGYCEIMLDEGIYADLMTAIPGLDAEKFDTYYEMATVDKLDNYEIRYLHYNHLIANKKATDRPKDRLDIEELEKRNPSN